MTARHDINKARHDIANCIHARQKEIFFTSGGTESDNWALEGVCKALKNKGKHIIVSSIEHHAVLNTCASLETEGYDVSYLPVNANGMVEASNLEKSTRPDTVLISIMFSILPLQAHRIPLMLMVAVEPQPLSEALQAARLHPIRQLKLTVLQQPMVKVM